MPLKSPQRTTRCRTELDLGFLCANGQWMKEDPVAERTGPTGTIDSIHVPSSRLLPSDCFPDGGRTQSDRTALSGGEHLQAIAFDSVDDSIGVPERIVNVVAAGSRQRGAQACAARAFGGSISGRSPDASCNGMFWAN